MTFTEIKTAVMDYCVLTSTEAGTRVGKAINRHHKRVTSELGMDVSRFVTRAMSMTVGVQTVTFTSIEKIDRIICTTSGIDPLVEVGLHDLRFATPGTGAPTKWAPELVTATTVKVLFDTSPQTAYDVQADGWTTLSDLSGTDTPVFAESFHDILTWSVIAEELLKKEKDKLSLIFERKAEKLLNDLKFHYADSPTRITRQGEAQSPTSTGSTTSGSGSTTGGLSYTQTGLITFDRDPSAPFAVTSSSAVVTNLDADKLDGLDGASYATRTGTETLTNKTLTAPTITAPTITGAATIATGATITSATLVTPAFSGTATGDLKLTDATYDIGKSGATRPRDLFISRNGTIGGTLTVTGGQISFPATQAASSDANTLDDYEEGTWTPVLGGSGGTSGQSVSASGIYVKVGQKVLCTGRVTFTNKGTITTNLQVQGLPFTSRTFSSNYPGFVVLTYFANLAGSGLVWLGGTVESAATAATLYGLTAQAATVTTLSTTHVGNTTDLIFSVEYVAAA